VKSYKVVDDDIKLEFIEGLEDVKQSVQRILSTRKGEWFLNTDFGLNFDNIITKGFSKDAIELDVTEAILQDSRIDEVVSVNIEHDRTQRIVAINFVAKVNDDIIEGEVIV
jgi:phage baseplate assembly protein W